jgi:polyhydroxybutyrate depolymerase
MRLKVGGLQRSALVHVPKLRTVRPMAVVLAFHGAGGSGASMERYSEFSAFSDRDHFISVYPSAVSAHRFWTLNDNDPSKPDDVAFVSVLLGSLERSVCMDPQRVYATGVSNGGGFAARLGCEVSSRIAAIAPVAGGYRSLGPCHPDRPVSVLEIHGDSDPVVPYDGKPPDYAGSVPRFLSQWAELDDCPAGDKPRFVARGAQRFAWGPCAEEADIQHLKLAGVGHTWPGGDDSRGAPVSAAREVWLFFRGRTLAPPAN